MSWRKDLMKQLINDMANFGVVCIDNNFILHRMLERAGYQVFEDSGGWSGLEWYAALPKFDAELWGMFLPDGMFWEGGCQKPCLKN